MEELYGGPICQALVGAGYQAELFVFPAGEKSKVRSVKELLVDSMLGSGFRRDCMVIAVGGGVVDGDDMPVGEDVGEPRPAGLQHSRFRLRPRRQLVEEQGQLVAVERAGFVGTGGSPVPRSKS